MWWQNARCQKTRHDFISKMPGLLSRPSSTSSFFSAFSTSSPICSNFIFTSAQDPVSWSAGSGRADGGGQLGWLSLCPCCLWSLRPSISVRGKHLRNPLSLLPPPLTPEAQSQRHVSAKWSLYTVLTGPTSLSTGQSGKRPIIFFLPCFPGWSSDSAGDWRDDYKSWGMLWWK